MSKLKVLFVSSGNSNNGINPIIKLQADSLADEGIEITHFLIFGKGIIGYFKNIIKLRQFLTKQHVDLIHAHFGFCGIVSYFAKHKQRLVVSLMGDDILGSKKKDGDVGFKNHLLLKVNTVFSRYFYDFVIFKSKEMLLKSSYKGKAYSVIPNGVDLEVFHEVDKGVAFEKLKWTPEIQHLIYVTNPSRPEKNFQLVRDSFRELKECGYSVKLHIVYNEPSENLKYFYSASDVLLLSSFHEGSPNVIKEAMACNCPIVSTSVGDVEWVMDNVEGCYLSSFDRNQFTAKIKLALNFSKSKKRTIGVQKIRELGLDAETASSKIIQIYKELID